MQKTLNLFARIAKIDEAKREVWGVATAEMVDKEGEIFDYESSKPYFKAWSDEISKATDGKSLGNVREMHAPSAVGKLIDLTFEDDLKQIEVGAKIVDDTAWQKCREGVYTGFSIGGKYVKAWKDGEYVRFTAEPAEISVVDNPCVPGAHFTAVKADGSTEVRKFAQEGGGHCPPADKKTGEPVKKDLGTVSNLAYILQSACYIQMDAAYEAEYEADGSTIPAQLKAWVAEGAAILARMTQEELDELVSTLKAVRDKLGKAGAKHSAETKAHHSAIDKCMGKMAKLCKEAQDHCDALMGKDDAEMAAQADLTKVPAEPEPKIEKQESTTMLEATEKTQLEKANADSASALSKVTAVEKSVTDMKTEMEASNADLRKTLKGIMGVLEKLAEGGAQKVARTAVTITKEQDGQPGTGAEKPKTVQDAMKAAHANPIPMIPAQQQP